MCEIKRVIAYIDGFNLYYGLKSKGWRRYYWLNIKTLVESLLKPHQQLLETKYFTARITPRPHDLSKAKRQSVFLEALETLPDLSIHYGLFLQNEQKCHTCGATWMVPEEKMTDVNIATELLIDAFHDRFDTALIMSGDSDLASTIEKLQQLFPHKMVVVAFPPNRISKRLRQIAKASFVIGEAKIRKSQFPDEVQKPDGIILRRPSTWK